MNALLTANLHTKRRLQFREDGTFKILMFSDIQERADFDPKALAHIEKLLDAADPDLVLLGGDQCMGPEVPTKEAFVTFLSALAEPLEKREIPWAHVFGNHDHDLDFDPFVQQALYEAYPHCVSKHTDGIAGVTNFMLPICNHGTDEIGFNVWGLDTHQKSPAFFADCGIEDPAEWETRPIGMGCYDTLRFDQLLWYWNSSSVLEEFVGHRVPSLVCMHIAPAEFALAINNPDACGLKGQHPERLDGGVLNSGIFSAFLQRGDVRCIACGHTHLNHFSANIYGITACFDAAAGFRCYGDDENRGGRVFEICEHDPQTVKTYPLLYKEL